MEFVVSLKFVYQYACRENAVLEFDIMRRVRGPVVSYFYISAPSCITN